MHIQQSGVIRLSYDQDWELVDTRHVFDQEGNLISTEYLYEGTDAHRPHTVLAGDLLITTWDSVGVDVTIRIDRVRS